MVFTYSYISKTKDESISVTLLANVYYMGQVLGNDPQITLRDALGNVVPRRRPHFTRPGGLFVCQSDAPGKRTTKRLATIKHTDMITHTVQGDPYGHGKVFVDRYLAVAF